MHAIHDYFIKDGQKYDTGKFSSVIVNGTVIYEVIRIIEGVPLFLEDHLKRLHQSLIFNKVEHLIDLTCVKNEIELLIEANHFVQGNVRYEIIFHNNHIQRLAYYIPHFYPPPAWYESGVQLVSLYANRKNPSAKVVQPNLKQLVEQRLSESGAYEVILINEQGEITEGSRSNLFFIVNDHIYTAPDHAVLGGITRNYVLKIISDKQLQLISEALKYNELRNCQAAFLTGTSPGVIPIRCIDNFNFNSEHYLIKIIMTEYNKLVNMYISSHKNI